VSRAKREAKQRLEVERELEKERAKRDAAAARKAAQAKAAAERKAEAARRRQAQLDAMEPAEREQFLAKEKRTQLIVGGVLAVLVVGFVAFLLAKPSGSTPAPTLGGSDSSGQVLPAANSDSTTIIDSYSTLAPAAALMPDVVCQNLQDAQDAIQRAGHFFSTSHDETGQGRHQILDRDWVVVSQDPPAGATITGDPDLGVVKYGETSTC
jgi:hypothetical protein